MFISANRAKVSEVADAVGMASTPHLLPGQFSCLQTSQMYPVLDRAHRVIVKVGTSLIVDGDSGRLKEDWLVALAEDVARCRSLGKEVLIVASGAVALGRHYLSLSSLATRRVQKQAAASAGQAILTKAFHAAFQHHGMRIAQVLLTSDDTEGRHRHLNARALLDQLLTLGVVPLINENDAITCDRSRIGDNDRLAARVAQMLQSDLLILLSDIDGLYTTDPRLDANAQHVSEVSEITPLIRAMAGPAGTRFSAGGMITKIAAAEMAADAGCHTIIASGKSMHPLAELYQGARASWFKARQKSRTGRKAWIACALRTAGHLVADGGAKRALLEGKSLLPAGVLAVEGSFEPRDIIAIRDQHGGEIARGITAYSSREAKLLAGHRSHVFERLLGFKGPAEIIHCNDLVLASSCPVGDALRARQSSPHVQGDIEMSSQETEMNRQREAPYLPPRAAARTNEPTRRVLLIEPTIRPVGVALLREAVEVGFAPDGHEETLIEHLSSGAFAGVITRAEKITSRVIEKARNLRAIGQAGVGVDHIDVAAASEHGILVLNAPTGNAISVAEHAVMLTLALFRHVAEADQAVRQGDFKHRERRYPVELNGKTAFIVGFGRSGRETARRLRFGFNVRVLVWDRGHSAAKIIAEGAEPVSLEKGFAEADVVSLHIPHLPETTRLVSRDLLRRMKRTAYLINTARGAIIDKAALLETLREGRIAGAGLDVFEPEPPAPDDPLLRLPNVIFSPHIAGDTTEAKDRGAQLIAAQMLTALSGNLPEHIVNRDAIARWVPQHISLA
jgi:glutamate 5-kinase